MIDYRYPHTGLAQRAWDLRHTITFYDGLYVALAAALDLLTADIRLSETPGLACRTGHTTGWRGLSPDMSLQR